MISQSGPGVSVDSARAGHEVEENSLRYEGWRVAAASGAGVFVSSLFIYTFAVLLKPLTEEFSWSRESVSRAYGIAAITVAVCAAPLGYLLDRLGARLIVGPCVALFGCAFASLAALSPRLWHLYALFAVIGMAAVGTSPMAYARAVSSWFERRRGMALALTISGMSVGGMVHPPATHLLIQRVGWRGACLTLGGLVLAAGLPIVAGFVRERRVAQSPVSGPDRGAVGASVGDGLRSRIFWIVIAVLFCSSIAYSGAIVHMPALLTDRGLSADRGAMGLSVMGGAGVAGRLITGWLIDRFFAARVSFALLAIASLGTFLLAGAHSFATGTLAAALIGFGMGGELDVVPYLLSRYFGLRSLSTLYSFNYLAMAVAASIGPVLMGRAFDSTGSYETLLVTLASGMLIVSTLMLALPRYDALDAPAVHS